MSFDIERLYNLLPAIYRAGDIEHGEPLRALLSIIAEQISVIEGDIDQLYDDQFIETSAEWVVPYIGDLVGYRALHGVTPRVSSPRAEVAHTIGYRRRKGTVVMLEQVARDVTGWEAHAVEFFLLLGTTQYLNHLMLENPATLDLRSWEKLERLGTAFDSAARTVEVRRIAVERGRYNIPNIGIYLWRLDAYSLTDSPGYKVDDRRYMFSPLGNNTQLLTRPRHVNTVTQLSRPLDVPAPISRRILHQYFDNYYGSDKSLLLKVNGRVVGESAEEREQSRIIVCDLSDLPESGGGVGWAHLPRTRIALDPVLGRIAFPSDEDPPEDVQVTFHYGFSAAMSGGEYERKQFAGVERATTNVVPSRDYPTIREALTDRDRGVIEINDSGRYEETIALNVAANQQLELRATNQKRPTLVLNSPLVISGERDGEVLLSGLLITGDGLLVTGRLRSLRLSHCTLVPGRSLNQAGEPQAAEWPSIVVENVSDDFRLEIEHSIVGPVRVPAGIGVLKVTDSIVDSPVRQGQASLTPGLVSGALSEPLTLTAAAPAISLSIGSEGPYLAVFDHPTELTLASVRERLQVAIRAAHPSPAFTRARVLAAEKRLILVPGVAGNRVLVENAPTNPTASELKLDPTTSSQVFVLVSGALAPFPLLASPQPAIGLSMEPGPPKLVKLTSVPTTIEEARDQLQIALREAHSSTPYTRALVMNMDDRLLVISGPEASTLLCSAIERDRTTLRQLALDTERPAIAASDDGLAVGPRTILERTTVFGSVHVRELALASNVIFTGRAIAERRQTGCVRFSYVPLHSRTPRRYHCQPAHERDAVRVRPLFTSEHYGNAGYCQLRRSCPVEISHGAEDEAEMGVFHDLFQPQREANLRVRLEEYLRFCLEAGIFYSN